MKKLFGILALLTVPVFYTQAQPNSALKPAIPNNPNAPKFSFPGGDTHDFGTLKEGPKGEFNFVFVNAGKEPLVIQSAVSSCGCTTPDWPKHPILPGKKGTIKVVYATEGHVGPFNKQVFIMSNAIPEQKNYTLHIKGTVIAAKANAPKAH